MHLKKVGQCRLTSAEQAASIWLDSAMRRDVTLRYGCAVTAKKIRSSWSRVPLGGRISRQSGLVQDGGMVIGGASRCARQWFVLARARARGCVCVCVCTREQAVMHAVARTSHTWEGNEMRSTSWRRNTGMKGSSFRRRGVPALRYNAMATSSAGCRVHAPRSWRRARARAPFHLHNAAAADATRAQHTLFARSGLAMPRC